MKVAISGLIILSAMTWGQARRTPVSSPDAVHADRVLSNGVGDKNPDVRRQAAAALSLVGPREPYLAQVESMLEDKDAYVRVTAVASLLDLRSSRTVPALRRTLNDDAPEVSFAAARALWTLNDPEGRKALLAVLSGETKTSSNFLTSQKRDMLRMIHTPKTMFMFAMKQGIGFAPVPGLGAGVSSLQEILSDPGTSGRATAALLMAGDRNPEVVVGLKDALEDHDASVRAAAIHALALRNDPALMKEFIPLMDDSKETVRLRAAAGYLRLAWIKGQPGRAPQPVQTKTLPAISGAVGKKL